MIRLRTILPAILGILVTCAQAQYGFGPLDIVKWSTFDSGQNSQAKGLLTRVINNEAEFQAYWSKYQGQAPYTAPRGIQWGKEMLIAIHIGERSTGGYKVHVDSIKRERSSELVLSYVETTPSGPTTQALTSPWTIVKMDRTAGNPVFRKRTQKERSIEVTKGCGCCTKCTYHEPLSYDLATQIRLDADLNRIHTPNGMWWRELDSGDNGRAIGFTWRISRTPENFTQVALNLTGREPSGRDLRSVDWDREQVLALALGRMPGPGYSLRIDSVDRVGPTRVQIRYTVIQPPIGPAVVTNVSNPYAFIRMDRTRDLDRIEWIRRNFKPYLYTGAPSCDCKCKSCRARH